MTDLERVRSALEYISPDDREEWVKMGMAIKSELGDEGFSLWDEWSRQADTYDPAAARDSWRSFRDGGITGGTLFHQAKVNGWQDDETYQGPTPEQLAERRALAIENTEKKRLKAERAAAKTKAIWQASSPARSDHPYLIKKQVKPSDTLREISLNQLVTLIGYHPQAKGIPLEDGRILVVPVKVGDQLSTCEFIDGAGRKTALVNGQKSGGYWAAQSLPAGEGKGLRLILGEGVATALSAKEATGHLVVAALSCGNLLAVARMLRERYPAANLCILADLGNGQAKAHESTKAAGGLLVIPDFGPDRPEWATDFNDLAILRGLPAVRTAIETAIVSMAQPNPAAPRSEPDQEKGRPAGQETATGQSINETIMRLATLSPIAYDLVRKDEAKALGIRPTTLDQAVKESRKCDNKSDLPFIEVEPSGKSIHCEAPACLVVVFPLMVAMPPLKRR